MAEAGSDAKARLSLSIFVGPVLCLSLAFVSVLGCLCIPLIMFLIYHILLSTARFTFGLYCRPLSNPIDLYYILCVS